MCFADFKLSNLFKQVNLKTLGDKEATTLAQTVLRYEEVDQYHDSKVLFNVFFTALHHIAKSGHVAQACLRFIDLLCNTCVNV